MPITRGPTENNFTSSVSGTARSFSHTVDASTTMLFISIHQRADIGLTVAPFWNTTEAFILVHATTASGGGADMRCWTYVVLNPTATTANITYTHDVDNQTVCTAYNYLGTETSSVGAATNLIDDVVNNGGSITTVLTSGGSSGNALIAVASIVGGDASPATDDSGGAFNVLGNGNTGATATNDTSYYAADLLTGLPDGLTITWAVNDENCGQLIELVAAAAGGFQPAWAINSNGIIQ